MGERVRVIRHRGRLIAAKQAGPGGIEALRAEAEVLRRVQGPGLVELVGLSSGDEPALLTHWVGSRSLADVAVPMEPEQAAALCLALTSALARLHRAGLVHGAVDPSHVLLDADGRPVLCGFSSAGPIGSSVRRPTTDQARPHLTAGSAGATTATTNSRPATSEDLRPATDVAGLGRVLDHLVGTSSTRLGPARWSRAGRRSARARLALAGLAASAQAEDPLDRPSMSAFSRALRRAAPGARIAPPTADGTRPTSSRRATRATLASSAPSPTGPRLLADPVALPVRSPAGGGAGRWRHAGREDRRDGPRRRSILPVALALAVVAATSYFGMSAWMAPTRPRTLTASPAGSPAPSPTSGPRPSSGSASSTTATTSEVPSSSPGPVVEHDGHRFEIGQAGDLVAVGPWLCDGRPLPVVLRPEDGTVHLFHDWASGSGIVSARLVSTVDGATELVRVDRSAQCADLDLVADGQVLATLTAEDLR